MTTTPDFWLLTWALAASGAAVVLALRLRDTLRRVSLLHDELDREMGLTASGIGADQIS